LYNYTVQTEKNANELIEGLEVALKEVSFGILWNFEMHKKLEEKGFTPKKRCTVLEVCNPDEAFGILAKDSMASYFLPCKIVIIEDSAETTIGFTRPSVLIGLMENDELTAKAIEVEEKLKIAINNVK